MKNLQRYNLGELAKTYASDKDNVVCRAYDVAKLEASHAELEAKCAELEAKCAELEAKCAELLEAAEGIVSRWDSPLWKDQPHTGVFIDRLRAAIAKAKGEQL